MNNHPPERLLFVVAVDQAKLESQSTLKDFITQIEHNNSESKNSPLINQLQTAINGEKALPGKVTLLRLDVYPANLTIFAGVIEVDASIIQTIQSAADKPSGWQTKEPFVEPLLRAIFPEANADLTWTLLRVNELLATPLDSFSLLGMKGLGSR